MGCCCCCYCYRYHVPRSLVKDDENTLVLFEEFGGNPSLVNFQTITIGSVCGNAYEGNNTLELSCNECPISSIKLASFGTPQGTCGSFQKGSCESTRDTLSILQNVCKFLDVYLYYLLLM